MSKYELRKLEKVSQVRRWMVMKDGLAYAGFSTKKVAMEAMNAYIEREKKEEEQK